MFHSLASKSNRLSESPSIPLLQQIQECASEKSYFRGVELSSSQITKNVVDLCSSVNLQVLCKLTPDDKEDTFRQLDDLASELSTVEEQTVGEVIRLVVVEEPPLAAVNITESPVDYLSEVLPVAAQFMETHPSIGRFKGERNAHGNPMDNHVLGVCHSLRLLPRRSQVSNEDLPSSSNDEPILQQVMDILDVLPPTRLSLDAATTTSLGTAINDRNWEMKAWDIEPLVQCIDHFEFVGLDPIRDNGTQDENGLHQQIWKWQSEVQVKETYASCSDAATAESLHDYFKSVIR